jgi:DNA modification methylase
MKQRWNRKRAFENALAALQCAAPGLAQDNGQIGCAPQRLYDHAGMLQTNTIIHGDCIKVLNDGPEGWVDLVFADPPFNIGYLYHGYDDARKYEDYIQFSTDWMSAVKRALKPTGSFYLAIGDEYAADLCYVARRKLGFHMRNWIIWHYTFGQQTKKMFAKSHTHILYFTQHEQMPFTFNADAVRVASARQTAYNDRRANPKGKLPDDVWYLRPQETPPAYFDPASDTWAVSRVCGTFREREGWHGCQMPIEVLKRIILASSNPGDIVLDPFNGSGTTVVAAALLGRRYVGIEQSAQYVEFARRRLAHALEQVQKQSAPIHTPAQAPDGSLFAIDEAVAAAISPTRASRVVTETDALGRPRVPRTRAGRSAVQDQHGSGNGQ